MADSRHRSRFRLLCCRLSEGPEYTFERAGKTSHVTNIWVTGVIHMPFEPTQLAYCKQRWFGGFKLLPALCSGLKFVQL